MELRSTKVVLLLIAVSHLGVVPLFALSDSSYFSAVLNASYKEMDKGKQLQIWRHIAGFGIYGKGAEINPAEGNIYYLHENDWCRPVHAQIPRRMEPWIALIERGNCEFVKKILNAKAANASAVIIFDNDSGAHSLHGSAMNCHGVGHIVAVSISRKLGLQLVSLYKDYLIYMHISIGRYYSGPSNKGWEAGKTSVLFVLVSFILLMCISLAWLVFYYVQRFRYFYARDKKEVSGIEDSCTGIFRRLPYTYYCCSFG